MATQTRYGCRFRHTDVGASLVTRFHVNTLHTVVLTPGNGVRVPCQKSQVTPRRTGREEIGSVRSRQRRRRELIAVAGFLWFMAVIRDRMGDREPKLFATVFFGGGIIIAEVCSSVRRPSLRRRCSSSSALCSSFVRDTKSHDSGDQWKQNRTHA